MNASSNSGIGSNPGIVVRWKEDGVIVYFFLSLHRYPLFLGYICSKISRYVADDLMISTSRL